MTGLLYLRRAPLSRNKLSGTVAWKWSTDDEDEGTGG